MKVRFYIEKRKDSRGSLIAADRPVFMTVAFHGKRLSVSTGVTVDLNGWDPELQRVRREYPDAVGLNAWLETLKETAGDTWKALASLSEKPGVKMFREEFEKRKPRFSTGFFTVFYQFLAEGKDRWNPATYRRVRTIYHHLRIFEEKSGTPLTFAGMDEDFVHAFSEFYREKGNRPVTTRKAVNIIVWFLNWATEHGFNVYAGYRKFYRQLEDVSQVQKSSLYLNWDELMFLYHMQVEGPRVRRVRDIFCFMCFTGIRFSELARLQKTDVRGDHIVVRRPGRIPREIPLNRFSRHILNQYQNRYYRENRALPVMSLVTMNKYLRMLGHEAKLDRPVDADTVKGHGKAVIPLHQALTAGVAPHTFIIHALRLDIPSHVISSYTGVTEDIRVKRMQQEMAQKQMKKFDRLQDKPH